ncbi:hypothetical protein [Flavobacterium sp. LB2R40]|uniref:hypothetical protein n=1 Tax=Flavobacterium sp. LB2R40 TaxID=3401722 RepID=UPI003AB09536
MKFYDSFLNSFFSEISLIQEKESDKVFEATFFAREYNYDSTSKIEELLSFLQNRDTLHLSVQFGAGDTNVYRSKTLTLENYKETLDKEAKFSEEENINIVLTINKSFTSAKCTIYDLEVFTSSLNNLNAFEFINIYSKLFEISPNIKFEVLNISKCFYSNTITFSEIDSNHNNEVFEKRNEIIENFKSTCHFSESDKLKILPNDFYLTKVDASLSVINKIFKKYSTILSIIYLFDITSLNENEFSFKLNGYKSIKGTIQLDQIDFNQIEEYLEIYKWVYNGGNLNDKIGLARNIISLHFLKKGELELQGNPFQAIQSSYKVYEKQNIKQYIEIRNKISDQLIDFNNRANKIIETFASGFQKSSLALISFYISAIAIRVLGKGEFTSIFTLDATVLSLSFLLGSLIYYWVSRWEINEQRKRFISSYKNLKIRYTDLLDEEDINRILNNDNEFNEDVKFIDDKKKNYSRMWIAFIAILGFTTILLFTCYNLKQMSETYLFRLLFSNSCDCN